MGGCFSSASDYGAKRFANVVTPAGELRQYPTPVRASQVLDYEACPRDSFFVCSSDGLDFDNFVPAMDPEDELEPAQIYFVLPVSKLKHRLAAADMAALAVKASVALTAANSSRRRNSKARISPVLVKEGDQSSDRRITVEVDNASKRPSAGISKSRSTRKLQRYTSRRAKLARLSFKLRLTTINETSVLLN